MVTIIGLEGAINEILAPYFLDMFVLFILTVIYFTVWCIILYRKGVEILADFTELQATLLELDKDVKRVLELLASDATDQEKINQATATLKAIDDAIEASAPEAPPTP